MKCLGILWNPQTAIHPTNGSCWWKKKLWLRHIPCEFSHISKLFNHREGKPHKKREKAAFTLQQYDFLNSRRSLSTTEPNLLWCSLPLPLQYDCFASSPTAKKSSFAAMAPKGGKQRQVARFKFSCSLDVHPSSKHSTRRYLVSAPSLNLNWVATWPRWWTTY